MKIQKFFVVLSLFLATLSASANVSLKNGNFFVGYTDLSYPGGFEPKVERVFNSKTAYKGIFGNGWGIEYEMYLTVSADGSVVIHEFGGGAQNRFSPTAFRPEELDGAVDKLAVAAKKAGLLSTQEVEDSYRKHLKSDAFFRNKEWERFRRDGKVQPRQLATNTKLVSNRFSYQFVMKISGGYVRNYDSGRIEKFDDTGRLLKIGDKNSNFVELSYTKDNKLNKIQDNFNRKMFFSFNSQGLVERIQGENGKEATYKYNSDSELVFSKDVDGTVFTHKYSSDKKHYMTEIGYSDKTALTIAYFGKDKYDNVKSVKDRDGTLTEYDYIYDKADQGHSSITVAVKGSDSKLISSSKYEYFLKYKQDGEEWTYKMVTSLDGDKTETTYNECCGLPLIIKKVGEETTFAYDDKGHVTKKISPNEVTVLSYDENAGKVAKVERFAKGEAKTTAWATFKYDEKGNLILAKNSENKGVQLFYDANGRIKTLLDQGKHRIDFKYNESSKPIEISDPSLGTISVSYNNSGEIKKVDSPSGRKIALQVTSAFQNLLDIIRPAGVSLSF